jgi:hypothetical protein
MISIWHKKSNTLFYSSPNQTPPPPPYSSCPPPPPPPTTTTTTTVVHTTVTLSLLPAPVPPNPRSPLGDTDVPRPLPQTIQAARPLFIMQPLRLLAFHLLLLLERTTYLPLEPRTALTIVRLLSALQVISVVDGLFRYLRRTN